MKRTLKKTAILMATCALPAVTLAGSPMSGPDFIYRGFVELEHLNGDFDDENVIAGQMFFNWAPAAISSYGLGVTGGLEGITLLGSSSDDYLALWLALTYTMAGSSYGDGVLSFGFPTSPIDDYASTDTFNGTVLFDFELSALGKGSFVRSANLFESDRSLGVRYDATSGPLSYGVAFHRVETDFDDINSYSAAARYTTGALTFAGGIEHLRGDSDTATLARAGVEADYDPFGGHLYVYKGDSGVAPDGVEVSAYYKVMPNLKVSATYIDYDFGDARGISAQYDLTNGGYVQGGLLDVDTSDTMIDLSVGYRF